MTEIGRAAVTGGAGFVGSTLVDQLLAGGTEVLVVDDLSHGTTSNLDSALATGARLVELDIRDAGQLERELAGFRPDVVFHLAAQIDVRMSMELPALDTHANVIGSINTFQAALEAGARRAAAPSRPVHGGGAGRVLAVFRDRDTAATVVVDGRCPHAGAPMEDGWLHDGAVVCPWHRHRFSPRDGRCENNARYRLPTYPTTVVNGHMIADVPFNPLGNRRLPGWIAADALRAPSPRSGTASYPAGRSGSGRRQGVAA
jgi:nitrite reductase/ring-hydroxylating ferredoxin subunit